MSKSFSDFWLSQEAIQQYVPDSKSDQFSLDLIQLASYRRLVSNFVYILTKKDIPIQFCTGKDSQPSFTNGKMIYLSASIRRKSDFDWSVGIALHEATHILVSDFDLIKTVFSRIPMPVPNSLQQISDDKNVSPEELYCLVKWMWNFVEDIYIDSYTFKNAPGYRGYYKAMYERFCHNKIISKALKSKAYRRKNLQSYEYRIINLTNPSTQLDALPGLEKIANLLEIRDMLRLTKATDRLEMAYQCAEIVLSHIDPLPKKLKEDKKNLAQDTLKTIHDKLCPSGGVGKPVPSQEKNEDGEKNERENSNGKSDKERQKDDMGDASEFSDEELEELSSTFKDLKDFLNHDYKKFKETVSEQRKAILDIIEKSGMVVVPAGFGMEDDYTQASVDCIVVKKVTKELVTDPSIFPLSAVSMVGGKPNAPKEYEDAVNKGFRLGRLLGRKLQIRAEEKHTKYIRKPSGKIERRLLSGIGAGLEDIFHRIKVEKYNKARLHISVDSSSSMWTISKWGPTMTCLTAICVAASMVENLSVSVSFRSTIMVSDGTDLPYIVLAYDSTVDKISKVRLLFPFFRANGATPEGLAFEAIAEEFIIGRKTTEQDRYFLNISDGEPAYHLNAKTNKYGVTFNYIGEVGALHTKQQVDKIRARGVKILSYFISDGTEYSSWLGGVSFNQQTTKKLPKLTLKEQFQLMYGKDAQFIDVQNVTDIARTVNKLFLTKV